MSVSEELADADNESVHGNESCSFSQVPADEPKMTKKAKISVSPQLVDNKRKQMEKALSQSKRDQILMNATKEDIIMKKQMISSLEESNKSLQSVMQKMTESLNFMAERISAGMRMIATAMASITIAVLVFSATSLQQSYVSYCYALNSYICHGA